MLKILARWHRWLGIVLILPLLGWGLTGLVFHYKPGYAQAYEKLPLRFYPMQTVPLAKPDPDWLELRRLRTILGEHLLVRTGGGWQQLGPQTLKVSIRPDAESIHLLISDALQQRPKRYGQLAKLRGMQAFTTTGVALKLDWPTLTLSQTGPDTRIIKTLYAIHYLRWTGIEWLDRALALIMVIALLAATLLGSWLLTTRRNET